MVLDYSLFGMQHEGYNRFANGFPVAANQMFKVSNLNWSREVVLIIHDLGLRSLNFIVVKNQ